MLDFVSTVDFDERGGDLVHGDAVSEAVNESIAPATGCLRVQAKARPAAQAGRLGQGRNARLRPEAPRH